MTNASNIRMDGNALIFILSGLRVEFPWPVTKVVEFENAYVAMIEPDTSSCFNENIFGVALDGKLLWQIEARRHVYADSPYTYIGKSDDNAKLGNWDGDDLIVEPLTGKILNVRYSK